MGDPDPRIAAPAARPPITTIVVSLIFFLAAFVVPLILGLRTFLVPFFAPLDACWHNYKTFDIAADPGLLGLLNGHCFGDFDEFAFGAGHPCSCHPYPTAAFGRIL